MTETAPTAEDTAAEAREILAAAELVVVAGFPTDRKDVLRVKPDNIDPAAVSVDCIAIHHGRNGNKAEAFRALDAAKAAMRAAGWYVQSMGWVTFRTAPGELPAPPPSRWSTLTVVVDADQADSVREALRRHEGVRFCGTWNGVTPAAHAAGADPSSWDA